MKEIFIIINADTREKVDNPVQYVLETGKTVGLANHTVLVAKDGHEYQIADSAAPIRDGNGDINGVVLVFRDVTKAYRARKQILETKELLESTMNAIPDAIGVLDDNFNVIRYNQAGYDLLGLSPEQTYGKKCYNLVHRDSPCEICAVEKCYRSGQVEQFERYEADLDMWVDLRAYPILDKNGRVVKVIEHFRDITSWKKHKG